MSIAFHILFAAICFVAIGHCFVPSLCGLKCRETRDPVSIDCIFAGNVYCTIVGLRVGTGKWYPAGSRDIYIAGWTPWSRIARSTGFVYPFHQLLEPLSTQVASAPVCWTNHPCVDDLSIPGIWFGCAKRLVETNQTIEQKTSHSQILFGELLQIKHIFDIAFPRGAWSLQFSSKPCRQSFHSDSRFTYAKAGAYHIYIYGTPRPHHLPLLWKHYVFQCFVLFYLLTIEVFCDCFSLQHTKTALNVCRIYLLTVFVLPFTLPILWSTQKGILVFRENTQTIIRNSWLDPPPSPRLPQNRFVRCFWFWMVFYKSEFSTNICSIKRQMFALCFILLQ